MRVKHKSYEFGVVISKTENKKTDILNSCGTTGCLVNLHLLFLLL
jgi:hypothetical protein